MEAHRFLDSSVREPEGFKALGHAGSDHYIGLELFDNPGCAAVEYFSDELTSYCPVTKQKDFYEMKLTLLHTDQCIESKSLKLWLRQFDTEENSLFCEALACYIRDSVAVALGYAHDKSTLGEGTLMVVDQEAAAEHVQVILTQKSRGGISIKAVA